jgi:hypothetical protein
MPDDYAPEIALAVGTVAIIAAALIFEFDPFKWRK